MTPRPRPRLTVSCAAPRRSRSELWTPGKWSWQVRTLRSAVRFSALCPKNPLLCRSRCRLKPARRRAPTALHLGTRVGTARAVVSHLAAPPLRSPGTGRTPAVFQGRRRLSAAACPQTGQPFHARYPSVVPGYPRARRAAVAELSHFRFPAVPTTALAYLVKFEPDAVTACS